MEVICRTLHSRFLLRPSRDLNEVFIGNPAKEAGRLSGWRERIRSRRYTAIVVSHDEATQSLLKEIEHEARKTFKASNRPPRRLQQNRVNC